MGLLACKVFFGGIQRDLEASFNALRTSKIAQGPSQGDLGGIQKGVPDRSLAGFRGLKATKRVYRLLIGV